MSYLIRGFFSAFFLLSALPSLAQTVPDAGVLLQQIEQKLNPIPSSQRIAPTPEPLKKLTGETVIVTAFKFSGNTRLSNEVLQAVVAPYLNRPLDFAQLQAVAARVGSAYREAGWIVRAYLPQQEIADGVVTIEIVEAVFGGAKFDGTPATRLANAIIQKYVETAQPVGEALNARAIDRVLLLLSDVPGAAISGNLREGLAAGQTNLVMSAADKALFSGDVSVDNSGSRSTGIAHVSGGFSLNSPFGRGDQLSSQLMLSDGSSYGRLAFSVPLGYQGWRAGLSGSSMNYRLVAPEFQAINGLGASSSVGLDANYPLIRSRLKNLFLALNYDHKYFNNMANQATTTQYRVTTISAGLNGNVADTFFSGGMNSFGLTWVQGNVNLNGSPNQLADAATTQVNGRFNKLRYSASRQQTLTESVALYAAFSGQLASKNLDSGEKFYLGGSNGVRAYPASEGGGSDGQLLNLELRTRLPYEINLTGFYDWGHVTVNRNNSFVGAPLLNNFSLQGVGASVGWLGKTGFSLKATLARRIGSNPNPTAAGKDQDGTLYKNRVWLQAAMPL